MQPVSFYARNPQEREALRQTHVTIAGCGSFGSALADMLVRAGLGRLTLIDPETLSIENIGRHVLTLKEIGLSKAQALAGRLKDVNPELDVEARQENFQDGEGLLVSCVDSRRAESMINAAALARRLPSVYLGAYGAVRAGEVQFCVPGKTACRECFAQFRAEEEHPATEKRYIDPDFDPTRVPGQAGLWGSVLAVTGIAFHGILALLGIRGTLNLERPLWIINFDYEHMPPYQTLMAKVPVGCAVCDPEKIADLEAGIGA